MTPATTIFKSWHELPFPEIWVYDTEFYPGKGLANGGREGDASTPLCLVALELCSNRIVRLWQSELDAAPPFRLDKRALFVAYTITAEFGCHIALGWPEPACALDAYVEFRHCTNDGRIHVGDRDKGFYSLAGALRYFCEDSIDTAHKTEMRDRIIAGPPFGADERAAILEYCEEDVRALARLLNHIVPTIRSLPQAMFRARFQWAMAQQERRGVPVHLPRLERVRSHWSGIKLDLVREQDREFGIYEIVDGVPHWRQARFEGYVRQRKMIWPMLESGALDTTDETFRAMAGRYPQIETLRELRYSLSKLRLHDISVGSDGRNRTLLGAYGTKTARNAPSNARYIFGPAKWIRFFIAPPPGRVLIHRDYAQQEIRIAAVLSQDAALLQACETPVPGWSKGPDVYLGIALQLGLLRDGMTELELKVVRVLFKTVVLGIQYGLGVRSLALRAGISVFEAREILARLKARFRVFEDYAQRVLDHAGIKLEVRTPYGWVMQCLPGINPRTVRNFPIQSTGAEILHVACILAEQRGIRLVASVHDALMAEAECDQEEDVSAALDRVMRDAAVVVLRGYELPTDRQIVRAGERFFDERGQEMWRTITRLVAGLEQAA
jgi:hypothetical protein